MGIIRGWVRAADWIHQPVNHDEYFRILKRRTFSGHDLTNSALQGFYRNVRIHRPEQMLARNRPGGGLSSYLEDLRNFLHDNGRLKKEFQPGTIFHHLPVVAVLQEYLANR